MLLSIILTMSILSLQFKPYDGATQLARLTMENMNHVALEVQKAHTCQKGAWCDSRDRQIDDKKTWLIQPGFIS